MSHGELLKAVGLDELLLYRCPGGEGERHDSAPFDAEDRLHLVGEDRPGRGYPLPPGAPVDGLSPTSWLPGIARHGAGSRSS